MILFSLQGVIKAAIMANGKPGKLLDLGYVPEATLALAQQTETKSESRTGQRLQVGEMVTGRTGTLSGIFDSWDPRNLALGLHSTPLDIAAGSVTGEEFPTGLVAGDEIALDEAFAEDLVLTDSAGTPATVGVDKYELIGHSTNQVRLLDVAGFTQPFVAAYDYGAATNLAIFSQPAPERWIIFDGINTETNEPVLIDLYRGKFAPFANIGLIHAGYGNLPFTASLLADVSKAADAQLGMFGRIRTPGS
jgi:hypothetical protein